MWETLKTPLKKEWIFFPRCGTNSTARYNSDTFAAHFAQHFYQKPTPQHCREIIKFEILSKVNPIGYMKFWSKYSCTLCTK